MTLVVKLQESVFILCGDELVHVPKTKRTAATLLRCKRLAAMLKLESASGPFQAEFSICQVAEERR